jgi:phage-related protein
MFHIEFYEKEKELYPAYDFINNLDTKMKAKIYLSIELLEEKGNQLREPYTKPISDGIFELRVKVSTDITRIFFFFYSGNKIILTNGYVKKQQKMDISEFEKAKKYKQDYEEKNKRR